MRPRLSGLIAALGAVMCSALLLSSAPRAQEAGEPPARSPLRPQASAPVDIEQLEPAVDVSDLAGSAVPVAQAAGSAIDALELGTTSITGNQGLPKVLYIVPWKRSDLGDLVGRPVKTLLDEVLAPVDPEVFERHLEYYDTLYGVSEEE